MKLKSNVLILILVITFQACSYYPEDFEREDVLEISETSKYIKIGNEGSKALIFYPGGLVDPFAYVNFLSRLHSNELTIFIPKVPYNLAILNIGHAQEIKDAFPDFLEWHIGGHSLGGAVACFVVNSNPEEYENMFLLASYPSENTDLKSFKGNTLSVYGSLDGVADLEQLKNSKNQFNNPVDLEDVDLIDKAISSSYFYEIEGGNHSNFGNYGFQKGDTESTISRADQQDLTIEAISKIISE